jgi:ribosomal protein S18 acetylase RimI-like enzyme
VTFSGAEDRWQDVVILREAGARAGAAITEALVQAATWDGRSHLTAEQVTADPHLARYVAGWPRAGDFGTIAVVDGVPVGAAWCRLFDAAEPGYGFVADDVLELSIGVLPDHRGAGIGTALLAAVVEQATARGLRAVSLSVEDGNPARALYERAGFVVVGRSGGSDTMLLPLGPPGRRQDGTSSQVDRQNG